MNILKQLDQKISGCLHQNDNQLANYILLPFSMMCRLPFHYLIGLNLITSFPQLIHLAFNLLVQLSILGILTYYLKIYFQRKRPTKDPTQKKCQWFRNRQSNCSMPSGDAIQIASFFYNIYGLGWETLTLLLLVSTSRVYFRCHWFGDTIVGSSLALIFCWIYKCISIKQLSEQPLKRLGMYLESTFIIN